MSVNGGLILCVFCVLVYPILEVQSARAKKLPDNIQNCHRSDPKLNECLLNATEIARPYLKRGIPELGLPSLEPITIPEVTLEQGSSNLKFIAKLKNIVAEGLTEYKFSKFEFDVPNLQFLCQTNIPGLKLKGDYTINGQILVAPIEGSGQFNAKIDSCNATVHQKYKIKNVKGVEYLDPVFTNTTIEVSGPQVELDSLFGGNEELTKITNKAINDNVDDLFQELRPVVEKVLTELIENLIIGSLTKNIPWDSLYPK